MDDTARTALRGNSIGFVFQFHHLIQAFTALNNVLMPLMLKQGKPDQSALQYAHELLAAVGLDKFADRKPNELSGGQAATRSDCTCTDYSACTIVGR
jgi:ABC-type antimicrobial peptide transport system, ATPase component